MPKPTNDDLVRRHEELRRTLIDKHSRSDTDWRGWLGACDWNGIVCPKRKPKGFHEANYLAGYFDRLR